MNLDCTLVYMVLYCVQEKLYIDLPQCNEIWTFWKVFFNYMTFFVIVSIFIIWIVISILLGSFWLVQLKESNFFFFFSFVIVMISNDLALKSFAVSFNIPIQLQSIINSVSFKSCFAEIWWVSFLTFLI